MNSKRANGRIQFPDFIRLGSISSILSSEIDKSFYRSVSLRGKEIRNVEHLINPGNLFLRPYKFLLGNCNEIIASTMLIEYPCLRRGTFFHCPLIEPRRTIPNRTHIQ